MYAEILEIFKQMSFLSSVLAGFAITVAIQLISVTEREPLVTAAMAVFLISSVVSAVATFIFVAVMTGVIGPPGFPHPGEAWIVHFVEESASSPSLASSYSSPASAWSAGYAPSRWGSSRRRRHCWDWHSLSTS